MSIAPAAVAPVTPRLLRISPSGARVGQGFNVQPNGESAISVETENATRGTVIVFGNRPLVTAYGSPSWLTALVPTDLLTTPGQHDVYLQSGETESNRLPFVVEP